MALAWPQCPEPSAVPHAKSKNAKTRLTGATQDRTPQDQELSDSLTVLSSDFTDVSDVLQTFDSLDALVGLHEL